MGQVDLATVAAANDAWVLEPEGSQVVSQVVETAEYRLVRFPEPYADPPQVQWGAVYAAGQGRAGRDRRAGRRVRATGGDRPCEGQRLVPGPLPAALEMWRTTPAVARDANTIGTSIFGGSRASDERLAQRRQPTVT